MPSFCKIPAPLQAQKPVNPPLRNYRDCLQHSPFPLSSAKRAGAHNGLAGRAKENSPPPTRGASRRLPRSPPPPPPLQPPPPPPPPCQPRPPSATRPPAVYKGPPCCPQPGRPLGNAGPRLASPVGGLA